MLDGIPTQTWILILIAVAALPSANYLRRYIAESPRYHDITAAPQDLSWRTRPLLLRHAAVLAGLAALAVFIFTPDADRLAALPDFPAGLIGLLGLFAAWTVFRGFRTGTVELLIRGFRKEFHRGTQPRRYWASMVWNAVWSFAMLFYAFLMTATQAERTCGGSGKGDDWQRAVRACDALIAGKAGPLQRWGIALADARSSPGEAELADYYADRGRAHYMLGNLQAAIADYGRALDRDPVDSYSLYNRGLAYGRSGQDAKAAADFSASLELRPGNADAYFERGRIRMITGDMPGAIEDFTQVHALDPDDEWALANRGISHLWMDDTARAEADFARVEARDPQNPVLLRGRALLAMRSGDPDRAIAFLTKAIKVDPHDEWSLRRRADLYWEQGQEDLARADDDVINAIAY